MRRSQSDESVPSAACLVLLLTALLACAPHPELKSPLLPADLDGMGVVVGSLTSRRTVGILGPMESYGGHELTIKGIQTGKPYTYTGAGYFQWVLPPGEYALTCIGLSGKDLVPKSAPFRFFAETGTIKCLGSVVTDGDVSNGEVLSRKTYVLTDRKGPTGTSPERAPQKVRPKEVELYVVKDKGKIEEAFRRRNPALSLQPVIEDHMF